MVSTLERREIASLMRVPSSTFDRCLLLVPLLLAIGCASSVATLEIPFPPPQKPINTPNPLTFPAAESSHDVPLEWWYYNGHLTAESGDEYSFHFVVFKSLDQSNSSFAMYSQMGILEIDSARFLHSSSPVVVMRYEQNMAMQDGTIVDLELKDARLIIDKDGNHRLNASDASGAVGVSLMMPATDAVMLHQEIGWMKWPTGYTYYYSYPRLKADGYITFDGEHHKTSGEVWFDHQWGDFVVIGKPAGWQWFALHLDDGRSVMISELRDTDGGVDRLFATVMDADGVQRDLDGDRDGVEIETLQKWISPRTNGEYPSRWRVKIDDVELDIFLEPLTADQEVMPPEQANPASAYWEGRLDVFDAKNGFKIGKGYAELSGYVDAAPLGWRVNED